jgi:hypothetical protein
LNPAQTRFRYHVETRARDADRFGQIVDRVPAVGSLEYDLARPAIAPINTAMSILFRRTLFLDVPGSQIVGVVDPVVLAARGRQQLLILHHHNPPPQQAEVVELRAGVVAQNQEPSKDYRVFLPLIGGPH